MFYMPDASITKSVTPVKGTRNNKINVAMKLYRRHMKIPTPSYSELQTT